MVENIVNSGSHAIFECLFKDQYKVNVTPTLLVWSVIDPDTSEVLQSDVTETPTSYKHNIVIPVAVNTIQTTTNEYEHRRVRIAFTYGASNYIGTDIIDYKVRNLEFG